MSGADSTAWSDEALAGFAEDDLCAAFACFRVTAARLLEPGSSLRPALAASPGLVAVAKRALELPARLTQAEARRFFTDHFAPRRVRTSDGSNAFFTGYYEPVVDGALERSDAFRAPLLARPADLRTFAEGEPRPPGLEGYSACRAAPDGTSQPYPDRTTIEAAIPAGARTPLVWVRDWVEAFFIHVQGSARVRLPDGRLVRIRYAGRNGHPYTSIGRLLAERGAVAPGAMSLDRLKAWLRAAGQEPGDAGRAVMASNASFIFFARDDDDGQGPIGGGGVPLTPLRSIAVDRTVWSYGLPFWVAADLPWQAPEPRPFRRLMVAQDTGSAILGPARADLFIGTGEEAGRRAGDIRHRGVFVVLEPREPTP